VISLSEKTLPFVLYKIFHFVTILILEYIEGLISVKPKRVKHLKEWPDSRRADLANSCKDQHATEAHSIKLIRRNYNSGEIVSAYKDVFCFTTLCGHAHRKTDLQARNIHLLLHGVLPVQHGRPGMVLKSIAAGLRHKETRKPHKITRGSALLAGCYYSDSANYYHFWCDSIVDIWMFRRSGRTLDEIDSIIMPFSDTSWQAEILKLVSIPPSKILALHQFTHARIEKAFVCFRPKGGRASPLWLHNALQEMIMPAKYNDSSCPKRIYASRSTASRRGLMNEDKVIDIMIKYHYHIVDCSSISVRDQISLFRNADKIIAPHGASLTNIAWCKAGTKVLDLMPVTHANPCFFDLAFQGNIRYYMLPTRAADSRQDPLDCPVVADVDELEQRMNRHGFT